MPDAASFAEFYRATRHRVLQYLYAASGDWSEAQDAAQEAYSRAWSRWRQVGELADPEGWVRVVGWRVLANRWRKVRGAVTAYRRHGAPDPSPPPGEGTVLLVAALRRLPREQREAVVLHHVLEQPVARIAADLGVPVGTVKARLFRGRQALAKLLDVRTREDEHA